MLMLMNGSEDALSRTLTLRADDNSHAEVSLLADEC